MSEPASTKPTKRSPTRRAANPRSARTSRSLEYGLSLLRQFTAEQPVRGIAELAQEMSVSRPTAHRYAATCLELGYLEQGSTRRYRLTRRSARAGNAMVGSLRVMRAARPILRALRGETGRTVSLAVLDGGDVLYLGRLCGSERGQYELERGLGAGTRRPARETAAGRALLAAQDASEPGEAELVLAEGGLKPGARGLAIAVRADRGGETEAERERLGALEVTVPAEWMTDGELTGELGGRLRAAAAELAAALAREPAGERVAS
jgi:IclR family transcriptional regulator, pca regulon regulatory protein